MEYSTMPSSKESITAGDAEVAEGGYLILFTCGDAPRSKRARANLKRALLALAGPEPRISEVDLLLEPIKAPTLDIIAAPVLLVKEPDQEPCFLYGDLSKGTDIDAVMRQVVTTR